ncbi:MAG: ATP-binding cassette domain-containing protein [Steroidobacteraceae bacterium]
MSWTIRPGERWVLVGANGAGKTQLLKVLAGAVWPTPDGANVRQYRWRTEVWHTPQDLIAEIAYLGPERQDKYERYGWNHTVEQVVGTGIHRTDIPLDPLDAGARRRVAALLRRLRIAPLAPRRFLTLSYGERRLVLLARALAARPRLLLLDELLNGLDTLNRARALRWLESTAGAALPWVLSVHRAEDVPAVATHVLILDQGRVAYRGERRRAPLGRWLSAGPPANAAARTLRRLSRPGAVLVELQSADVYLDEHVALRNVTFTVRAGECWVVHGRNGAGKTTLLRTLYGDHGVAVGGRIVRAGVEPGVPLETFRRRAALVAPHLQADHPLHLCVAEVVQSGRYASIGLNDAPNAADSAAARRAMREFDVLPYAQRTLRELSYGQLRRVLFARAWVARPRLLLLDEPFAGLDTPTQQALQARIEHRVADGAAVVMVVHRRSEWPQCATHELQLAGGAPRYAGPVRLSRG